MRFDPFYWRHWWAVHLSWWSSDARLVFTRTAQEFRDDYCTQLAAGISYYVIFSIFPLAILTVSILGLVLTNDEIRADVVDELFQVLPLSDDQGREDLERAVDSVATGLSAVGLLSIFGLLWAASGMMGAIRHALDEAWDTHYRRPFLRAKIVDLFMVTAVGLLIGLSIGATVFLQVARRVSDTLSDWLGPLGEGAALGFEFVAILLPLSLSFATFMFIYKVVPSVVTRWSEIWPGALLAAILFEVVKNGFAFYLRYFGNYDAVYGSLGAALAFLFFVFVSSNILLLGAEMAAEWPRVIHGHYDADLGRGGPAGPLRGRVRGVLSGLLHGAPAPHSVEDTGERAARSARRVDEVRRRTTTQPTAPTEPTEPTQPAETGQPASPPPPEPAPDDAPDP